MDDVTFSKPATCNKRKRIEARLGALVVWIDQRRDGPLWDVSWPVKGAGIHLSDYSPIAYRKTLREAKILAGMALHDRRAEQETSHA